MPRLNQIKQTTQLKRNQASYTHPGCCGRILYFSGEVTAKTRMGRAYSDDLRIRILEADERGVFSCRELAKRFGVSWEYVRKLRQQQAATGQKARVAQSRYGVRSKVTEPVKAHMLSLVKSQPDLTLAELQERILRDKSVSMSWGLVHLWVRRLGLRLKKSRSTPSNETPKSTVSAAPSSTSASSRSIRKSSSSLTKAASRPR
jgi:transposase